MTEHDFYDTFWPHMAELFPRCEFNKAEASNWKARLGKVPLHEAMAALSDLHANAKGRPIIADFLKYVREHTGSNSAPESPKYAIAPSLIEYLRRTYQRPSASDAELRMMYAKDCFEQALDVYGPDQPQTRGEFAKWQSAAARCGYERMAYDVEYWTSVYESKHGAAGESLDVTSWLKREADDGHDPSAGEASAGGGGDVQRPADDPGQAGGNAVEAMHEGGGGEAGEGWF